MLSSKQKSEKTIRMSLKKKFLLCFAVLVVSTVLIFRYLPIVYGILAELVLFVVLYLILDKWLVRPIELLTISVIESRYTPNGFVYHAPDIHTGDELELLSDALKRMAKDNR